MAAKDIHGEGGDGKKSFFVFYPRCIQSTEKAARRYQCVLVKQTGKWEMENGPYERATVSSN
jgi:hypothetical protein